MNKSRGDMAITLVVVVFIMGILASIVLVNVGKIRQNADDVRIESGVVQFSLLAKTHSEAQNGSYQGFDRCLSGDESECAGEIWPAVKVLVEDVADAYEGSDLVVKVSKDGSQYCVGATLGDEDGTQGRCVDSDRANTANKNLICSDTAKCERPGSAIPVEPLEPEFVARIVPEPEEVVPEYCVADLNRDGVITFGDFILAWWSFITGDLTWGELLQFFQYWLDNRGREGLPYCPVIS